MAVKSEVTSIFKYRINKVNYSELEMGDIALHEKTGEYIMGGYPKGNEFNNLVLDLIIPRDKNYGTFIVFAVLIEKDIQLSVKASTEVLKEMFTMPHSYLLRKNNNGGYYDIIEPTVDIMNGDIIFVKLGIVCVY